MDGTTDERFNKSIKAVLMGTWVWFIKGNAAPLPPTTQMTSTCECVFNWTRCGRFLCGFVLRHDRNENPGTEIQRGQDGERERDAASALQGRRHGSGSGESHQEKATRVVSGSGLAYELCLDADKRSSYWLRGMFLKSIRHCCAGNTHLWLTTGSRLCKQSNF